jgi:hypothetical protein
MAEGTGVVREEVLFRETQRYTQPWLWLILMGVSAGTWYGAWQQLGRGVPFGTNPAPDGALMVILVIFGVLFPLFFVWLRLETEVRTGGIRARFFPFHLSHREWRWSDIEEVERRVYSPLGEYGGWGIRMGVRGWAYNVKGNEGIQLRLRSGQRMLIGTQQASRFMLAVERARAAARQGGR